MSLRAFLLLPALTLIVGPAAGACVQDEKPAGKSEAGRLVPIARSQLCVTKGSIEASGKRLLVTVPEMRAVVAEPTAPRVEARFTYVGPSKKEKRLGSGQLRRQFGLKLRAQNGCNLVYAMWRIEPESKLVVSVKSNPGAQTHAQCGTRGYRNIEPTHSKAVPRLHPGDRHTLRAEMRGAGMKVFVDNEVVWEGDVGAQAPKFDGPVGVRTDNGEFEFDLFAAPTAAGQQTKSSPCKSGDEGE